MAKYSIQVEFIPVLFCFLFIITSFAAPDVCKETRCKRHGPAIRFPFWLKGKQTEDCGYHGQFNLFCNEKKQTVLELPHSVKLFVKRIDYVKQQIHLYDPDACLPRLFRNLNLSTTPFRVEDYYSGSGVYSENGSSISSFTLFNCSSDHVSSDFEISYWVPCLSIPGYRVQALFSALYPLGLPLISCSKIYNISIPDEIIREGKNDIYLHWDNPICSECESKGKGCRLKIYSTYQTECFDIPKQHAGSRTKLIVTGSIVGSFLLALFIVGLFFVYRTKKNKEETRVKIKKFLEDYKALKPTRYSYADIKRITSQFKHKLGKGGFGTVFKGRLSNDVLVAVKVLDDIKGNGEDFINEMGSMGRIHHVNIARLVGYCADGYNRALVYEYLPNESLEKSIFSSNNGGNRSLSWEKLHDIALGIAKGIEYLHQGCDLQILHFDIKPHNILLDSNFNPKISDFGLAKLCPKEKSAVSMTAARGTMGYIAPEVLSRNFGNVSYKSDVYSYGMLLLEMVGGRENIDVTVENASQVYFPEWVYNRLDKREVLGIKIEDEKHANTVKKLAIVGLWCIQWYPVNRPSMKDVVQMLEGETDSLTVPPNPFASADRTKMNAVVPRGPLNIELAVISELE